MPLTDPGTLSPGRLIIRYIQGSGIVHEAGAWFKQPNDFGDIAGIRTEATAFATALMALCLSSATAISWRIVDPSGAELYSEPLSPTIQGALPVDANRLTSQSTSLSASGKAVPPTIGVAFGRTSTFVFPGFFRIAGWSETKLYPGDPDYISDLRDYLDGSLIVGADYFGQGAEYADEYNIQVNAHYQKQFGL